MIFQILNSDNSVRGFLLFDNNQTISYDVNIVKIKDVSERAIKYSDSFEIPRYKNEELIDPEIIGESMHRCKVYDDTMTNVLFDAYLHVDLATNYIKSSSFSVSLIDLAYSGIKYLTNNNLEELFVGETFSWDFSLSGNYNIFSPIYREWFLTTANLNGSSYNDLSSFPVYPVKFIDKNGQLFFTMSFANFISRAFDSSHANIPLSNIADTKILGNATMSDLYIYIPVNFVSSASVNDRSMSYKLDTELNKVSYTDWENQLTTDPGGGENGYNTNANGIISMCDTLYSINVDHTTYTDGFNSDFLFITGSGVALHPTSGSVYLGISYYVNDVVTSSFIFDEQLTDKSDTSTSPVTTTLSNDVTLDNIELDATDNLKAKFCVKFDKFAINYNNKDVILDGFYECSNVGFYNGVYGGFGTTPVVAVEGLPNTNFDGTPDMYIALYSGSIDININNIQNLSPMYSDTTKDTISLYETFKPLNAKISDVINDMLNRFDINLTTNSNGDFVFATNPNRYSSTEKNFVSFEMNGITYSYSDDYIGKFSYKNNNNGRIYDKKKYYSSLNTQSETYYLGDVLDYENGGNNDETISLNSSIGIKNIYGEQKEYSQGELDLLQQDNDDARWGLSTNTVMSPESIGIMHGFLSDSTYLMDLRTPSVIIVEFKDTNGNVTDSNYVVQYTNPSFVHIPAFVPQPIKTISGTDYTLYLGDENGVLDTTSELYKNFKQILSLKNGNYLQLEYLLTKEEINNIIDGYKITTTYNGVNYSSFLPLEINGIILGKDSCIIKIKMIKDI